MPRGAATIGLPPSTANGNQALSTEDPPRTATKSVDPKLVRDTQVEIRGLVDEIAQLSRSSMSHEEYFEAVLNRVVTALAAIGGALWMQREDGPLALAHQVNFRQAFSDDNDETLEQHAGILGRVLEGGEPALVGPDSGDANTRNPSPYLLVLAPLKRDGRTVGVLEVFQRAGAGPTTQRGYLRFVVEMSELVGLFLQSEHLRQLERLHAAAAELDQFARSIHQSLDVRQTAYTIANEGRRLIGCDRLSVATVKGRHAEIVAVSGQETIERRADMIKRMRDLVQTVVRTGQPLWYDGNHEDLAPQIESVIDAYVDLAHAKNVTVLPLRKPEEESDDDRSKKPTKEPPVLAALVIEQIERPQDMTMVAERSEAVAKHSAAALANAMDHQGVFLLPLWKTIGKARWLVEAQRLPKTLTVAAIIVFAIAALFIVPADLALEGRGVLQPSEKRDVFAPMSGKVKDVLVRHGQPVQAGQILVELESFELDQQILEISNQLDTVDKQIAEKKISRARIEGDGASERRDRDELAAEIGVLELRKRGLATQLENYEKHRSRLKVTSPVDGVVLTWQVNERLDKRPVERGQVLLTVANPAGSWELEIHMPEDRMSHVARAWNGRGDDGLQVSYILATAPSDEHKGVVRDVYESAEVRGEEGNGVQLRVDINESDLAELRPGSSVIAKVHCGKASLGYVWFGDVIHFIQSRILFRL